MIVKTYKLICFLLLTVFLEGCAAPFVTHEYLAPEADAGKAIRTQCNYGTGPEKTIRFPVKNTFIDISANEFKNSIHIVLSLKLFDDHIVNLSTDEVEVKSISSKGLYRNRFEPLFPEEPPWDVSKPIIGKTRKVDALFKYVDYPTSYIMTARSDMPVTDKFVVRIPMFTVNNVKVILPEITFRKKKSVEWFPPLNC